MCDYSILQTRWLSTHNRQFPRPICCILTNRLENRTERVTLVLIQIERQRQCVDQLLFNDLRLIALGPVDERIFFHSRRQKPFAMKERPSLAAAYATEIHTKLLR
jgi:hypothetical protein